jgi:hypothetical protein
VRIDAQVDYQPRFVEIQVFGFDVDPRTQGAGATIAADDPAGAQGAKRAGDLNEITQTRCRLEEIVLRESIAARDTTCAEALVLAHQANIAASALLPAIVFDRQPHEHGVSW